MLDNYYRGIILTRSNPSILNDKQYKLNEKYKESIPYGPMIVGRKQLTEEIIKRAFCNAGYDGEPCIVYSETNCRNASHKSGQIKPFVDYFTKNGELICSMELAEPENCAIFPSNDYEVLPLSPYYY